jgi:hypothetical protein
MTLVVDDRIKLEEQYDRLIDRFQDRKPKLIYHYTSSDGFSPDNA